MKNEELKYKDELYKSIEEHITYIKKKKKTYVTLFRVIKILIFAAVATITVLSGWQMAGTKTNYSNTILIISALITFYSAIEGLFDLKDKAYGYDVILFDLRNLRLQMSFDFHKDQVVFYSKKDDYFRQLQEILQRKKAIIEDNYKDDGDNTQ